MSGYSFQPHLLGNSFIQNFAPLHFKTRLDGEICSSGVKCISANRYCEGNRSDVVSNDVVMVIRTTTTKNWFN